MVSEIFANNREHGHGTYPRHDPCHQPQIVVAFPLHECLREAINIGWGDNGQCPPQIERDDTKQEKWETDVANLESSTTGTDGKLLSLPEKRPFWNAMARADIELIIRHEQRSPPLRLHIKCILEFLGSRGRKFEHTI